MTVQEHYNEAVKYGYYSLVLLIDYLVLERKVLKMNDNEDKLTYYLQDRFKVKLNEYLAAYERKRKP